MNHLFEKCKGITVKPGRLSAGMAEYNSSSSMMMQVVEQLLLLLFLEVSHT